mmetsp:Transcript_36537/g.79552  ORF Transcript_36537/g.79552 Transcript_36537/m.79552 type:complete len:1005 (+) Transcript_36537:357-3371(+)
MHPEPTAAATAVIMSTTALLLLLIGTISPSASVHLGVEAFTLSQRPLSPIVVSTRRRPYRRYGSDPPPSSQLAVPPLDVSRVPTGESFADAAAAEDTGSGSGSSNNSGASTGADGAVDEDKLPSFLFHGDGISGDATPKTSSSSSSKARPSSGTHNGVQKSASRSRSIRRFSAAVKKPSKSSAAGTGTATTGGGPMPLLSRIIPSTRGGVVKAVTLAATVSSLITCTRTIRSIQDRSFETVDLNGGDGGQESVLVTSSSSSSGSGIARVIRGGTAETATPGVPTGTDASAHEVMLDDSSSSTSASEVATSQSSPSSTVTATSSHRVATVKTSGALDNLVFTSRRTDDSSSSTTSSLDAVHVLSPSSSSSPASPTTAYIGERRYHDLSPQQQKAIEVLSKSALVLAGVGAGLQLSKPRDSTRQNRKTKAATAAARTKRTGSISALASTLERRIKPGKAKARREEKVHRTLLEAQLRYTAADQARKRLEEMSTQFSRLREQNYSLRRISDESKTSLMADLNSANTRLALAETSASGLSRELKRLAGVELALRAEVEELKAALATANKAGRELRVSMGAELKDAQWEKKSLEKELEEMKKELDELKRKAKEGIVVEPPEEIVTEEEPGPVVIPDGLPSYGRPILAMDIEGDRAINNALRTVRNLPTVNGNGGAAVMVASEEGEQALRYLSAAGTADAATLTLLGYKGGDMESQVNQDRAVIVSPFIIGDDTSSSSLLMGIFDGHSANGEILSEYATRAVPDILSQRLETLDTLARAEGWTGDRRIEETQKAFADTFMEVHRSGESEVATRDGGCTASAVLQRGDKVYVANCGDSKSIIATFEDDTADITVVYASRDDTPDLEGEKARIESAGGEVQEMDGGSRVLYFDDDGVAHGGLAISRALGDWDMNRYGVIPDPTVDVIDLKDVVKGGTGKIQAFAVSATDGLLDFVDRTDLLCRTVEGLYVDEEPHLFTKLEDMISKAKEGWYEECGDEYRDDITIAASKLIL